MTYQPGEPVDPSQLAAHPRSGCVGCLWVGVALVLGVAASAAVTLLLALFTKGFPFQ